MKILLLSINLFCLLFLVTSSAGESSEPIKLANFHPESIEDLRATNKYMLEKIEFHTKFVRHDELFVKNLDSIEVK